jgi:hypothetical protein
MPKPNTPADDYWILYVSYSQRSTPWLDNRLAIAFLPTGEIDVAHTPQDNLTTANSLLAPTTQLLQELFDDSTFDIWSFFNWIFVIFYWGLLADLGQVAPTAYDTTILNSPQPVPFPSTNNIFVNETLFQTYSTYFNNTFPAELFPPQVLLNDETRFQPVQTTLVRSYTCSWRNRKSSLDLIVSVIVAEYALIMGAYTIVRVITGWLQKRKDTSKFKTRAV